MNISILQQARMAYKPKLPAVFHDGVEGVVPKFTERTEAVADQVQLKKLFEKSYGRPVVRFESGKFPHAFEPVKIGVVLSGGQAPGGHNVIVGLLDAMKQANAESQLFGFLGGPAGMVGDSAVELTAPFVESFRNSGGFDMIGSGRTKIETEEQFAKVREVCGKRGISSIVVIGGDDSNTNAALLAEYFLAHDAGIQVIGVPKTIDGDLKNEWIALPFGFDTATRTYAELIGNIARDANSARKYWHFIKVMGRSASHICLECALQTQPNVAIISEEVETEQQTLTTIVEGITHTIVQRSQNGEDFGIVLIPEGLIEFIPEMKVLIGELNDILAEHSSFFATLRTFEEQAEWVNRNLSRDSSYVFSSLPSNIQRQLLMDRDPHGNVQVSRIETERLLIDMVEERLAELRSDGKYKGSFSYQSHFLGYEGRCAFPSNFDADYCYSLGFNAFLLIASGLTGYISTIGNLAAPADEWTAGGIPLTTMMNLEQRHGTMKPVIRKAMVDLTGRPFRTFRSKREEWALKTSYLYPGAIQYFGPSEVCDTPNKTLLLELGSR